MDGDICCIDILESRRLFASFGFLSHNDPPTKVEVRVLRFNSVKKLPAEHTMRYRVKKIIEFRF